MQGSYTSAPPGQGPPGQGAYYYGQGGGQQQPQQPQPVRKHLGQDGVQGLWLCFDILEMHQLTISILFRGITSSTTNKGHSISDNRVAIFECWRQSGF
jgi:hypothetical protein